MVVMVSCLFVLFKGTVKCLTVWGFFGDITGEGILIIYKCKQSTPSGCIGHSLMDTSCECMCVVKYEFVLWE